MPSKPIILFDGVCNLCNGAVQFVLARDPGGRFRFAALQSAAARRILGVAPPVESLILVDGAHVHIRSGAALRIARGLRFPWPILAAFLLIPWPLRDWIYDWIARRRYAWFGRRQACMIPKPEFQDRFVD